MNNKLKQIIFDKLYEDLKHVEIIPHNESIWFIDREKQYWYLEYKKSGSLWWRWQFFSIFFPLFSIEYEEYQWIIAEWVEEVLNCKVITPLDRVTHRLSAVEEVLNCKVITPKSLMVPMSNEVEEMLNCKVITPLSMHHAKSKVEEVLNCKVITPLLQNYTNSCLVEEVLNNSVKTIENE